jgi:tetraacyldisaccharide 4'-kinase
VPLYWLGLRVKDQLRGEPRRLGWPVVSVGSLSAGGAGKTPVVIALALMLKERGWVVDVLSRGYGRSGSGVESVCASGNKQILFEDDRKKANGNSDGNDTLAARYGDEPLLIAQRADVPVWVGSDRHDAGLRAEAAAASEKQVLRVAEDDNFEEGRTRRVHLLDDGFQHRQLARAVDVVLVTREDLDDALLPAGNRREGWDALRRADIIVVRKEEIIEPDDKRIPYEDDRKKSKNLGAKVDLEGYLKPLLREGTLIWTVRRTLRFPAPLFVFGAGLRPVAFCAIARPEDFAEMLLKAGCGVVDTIFFADHHAYDMGDMERIVELAKDLKASGFVTTEKDAVKLTPAMRARLETHGPVMVAALDAEFVFPERVARELEARLVNAMDSRQP